MKIVTHGLLIADGRLSVRYHDEKITVDTGDDENPLIIISIDDAEELKAALHLLLEVYDANT